MLTTLCALGFRIFSNPIANMLQKALSERHSAVLINLYSYGLLSLACVVNVCMADYNWNSYGFSFWNYVLLAGFLCTLGTVCLIKALQCGELSVLGPINSYKCLVGLLFGFVILGEIPNIKAILGVLLIICGSWFIFDTVKEGFSFKLFKRKDIILRFCALFLTGAEAAVLKKIILISSPAECFILWCFSGFAFSLILVLLLKKKLQPLFKKDLLSIFVIAVCLGLMQFSTNIVFEKLNVGLSLALFQLSSIIAIIFGYKVFKESHIVKKLIGAIIMIVGSCLILL
ncbi:EamA family transporter [bacterium]|nr:EamA family transporter [bacterium]